MTRRDLSSVDSIDGLCASSGPASTDEDTLSLYSEFELKPLKLQKLETKIGINHFNRYILEFFLLSPTGGENRNTNGLTLTVIV